MFRPMDIRDCSVASLEAMEAHLIREITDGRTDLQHLLKEVRDQIPHAPLYDIVHYRT